MEAESSFCCLELKYCERCGALWLRRAGGEESYCAVCFVEMEALPRRKERTNRRAAHRKRREGRDLEGVAADVAMPAETLTDSDSRWSVEGDSL